MSTSPIRIASLVLFALSCLPGAFSYAGQTDGIMRGNHPTNLANTKYNRMSFEDRTNFAAGPAPAIHSIHSAASMARHSQAEPQTTSYFEEMWGSNHVSFMIASPHFHLECLLECLQFFIERCELAGQESCGAASREIDVRIRTVQAR
jgi:hypothetical protein